MEKTKLGVSVNLLGAMLVVGVYFGGLQLAVLMAAYVLLFESNEWLKKTIVKAIAFSLMITVTCAVINLIPDIINWALGIINYFVNIIFKSFNLNVNWLARLHGFITSALNYIKTMVFLVWTFKALNLGTVSIPVVDKFVEKYM